jgi:hypothetical protein
MFILAAALTLALQAQDTASRPIPPDSYADSATAVLVRSARAARDRNERLVTSYKAKVSERIGVGLRALSRDRMLYRQETVSKISWRRDSISTIEVIGAREGVPVAERGDRIPEDLRGDVRTLVINPAEDYLRVMGSRSGDGFVYPLIRGGEQDYRYAIGDTTVITLGSGQKVRLVSLEVRPRRADFRLMSGTLWFDLDSYGLVRAVFRPARPYDMRRDADSGDMDGVPGFVNVQAEVKYVTVEYGFYESRWWMPRYVGIDATGSMGSWLNVPVRIERVYSDYEVEGGTPPDTASHFRPAGTIRRRGRTPGDTMIRDSVTRRRLADSIAAAIEECVSREIAYQDSVGRRGGRRVAVGAVRGRCRGLNPRDTVLTVVVPEDTMALLHSPELGAPILDMGDLVTEAELGSLRDAVSQLPARPWESHVELPRGVSAVLRNARFNRIEALSLGYKGTIDFGRLRLDGIARLGVADWVPNGEVSLSRFTPNARVSLTGYRRLAAANPGANPLGPLNSFMALVAQRDDGEYFRTLGIELTGRNANAGWWSGRLYAERQRPALVESQASLPHLFNGDRLFRPNILADTADEVGGSLMLRASKPLSRTLGTTVALTIDGATGDFDFGRGSLTLRGYFTPAGPVAAAVTLSAGTSTGAIPIQSRYYLGGANSLRGYAGGVLTGSAFWLGRFEVGNSFPAARLVAFSDVGWAGDRSEFAHGRPLIGAGVGASFLDGLFRIDLARALRSPTGWRLEFYVDGVM